MGNILGWGNFALGVEKFLGFFSYGVSDEVCLYSDAEMTVHSDTARI
jgi:hypothetical protein